MFSKIIKLIRNYDSIKNLKWTKKGVYFYVSYLLLIIKTIVSHPIFRIIKYSFNILLIFYIASITYLYLSLDVNNLDNIINSLIELHKNVIRYIRDKSDYLLNEQVVTLKENSNLSSIETEKFSEEFNISSNNFTSNNSTYLLWFSLITIVVISGVIIYYYPDILNYIRDIDNDSDSDLLDSPIAESPKESVDLIDLSDITPKVSSSDLPTS